MEDKLLEKIPKDADFLIIDENNNVYFKPNICLAFNMHLCKFWAKRMNRSIWYNYNTKNTKQYFIMSEEKIIEEANEILKIKFNWKKEGF